MIAVLAATPLLACVLPSGATSEESACCRDMADQCDHGTMPSSHPCCKTVSAPEQTALAKAPFKLFVHLLYFVPTTLHSAQATPEVFHTALAAGHSPPEGPPGSSEILRI
jgi:hypothetical protein